MTTGEVLPAIPEGEMQPAPVTRHSTDVEVRQELSVDELIERTQKIHLAMKDAMKKDEHYGVIPGTNKPTLLKPGAEKLMTLFMLDPEYKVDQSWHDEHLTVTAYCTLFHIPTGNRIASGAGLCSTREPKYAYRQGERKCPDCDQPAVVKSTKKSAYFCIRDKGGCGHRFAFGTPQAHNLDTQEVGRVPNQDLPDTYNTVLKMACKRALIAAVLNGTAASDVFTQDLEDQQGSGEADPAEATSSEPIRGDDSGQPASDPNAGSSPDASPQEGATERRMRLEKHMNDLLYALLEANSSIDWPASLQKKAQETFGISVRDELSTDQLEWLNGVLEHWLANVPPAEAPAEATA